MATMAVRGPGPPLLTRRVDAATPTTLLEERVAQLVEHLTFNQEVMGSNPIALTIKINELRHFPRLFAAGHPAPVSAR